MNAEVAAVTYDIMSGLIAKYPHVVINCGYRIPPIRVVTHKLLEFVVVPKV